MKVAAFKGMILILLASTTEGVDKKRRKKAERTVYERRKECENEKCGNLVPLEAQNCILECISPECYRKTFAEPLEDGEVNVQLNKIFMSCARKNAKVMNKKRPPRAGVAESSAGASLAESDRSSSPRESVVLLANGVVDEAMEPVDEDEDEDEGDELSLEEEFGEDIFALEDYA